MGVEGFEPTMFTHRERFYRPLCHQPSALHSHIFFAVTTRLELAPRTVTGWHCKPFNQATICGGDRTRTYNLSINSALLYAIELHPHIFQNLDNKQAYLRFTPLTEGLSKLSFYTRWRSRTAVSLKQPQLLLFRLYHFTLCTQAVILYLVALFVI